MAPPDFSLEQARVDDPFNPLLLLVETRDTSPGELTRAILVWTSALRSTGKKSVLHARELLERDPWFGFGVRASDTVLNEWEVTERLAPPHVAPVEDFVRALIAFNRENADALEGGLATHEELESGSASVEWLVRQDLRHLGLYLEFLASVDLEHTLEQVNVVLRLARVYSPRQLAPLVAWCEEHDAALLNDWLAGERAWKAAEELAP
ncbi:hypothetical protein P2318_13515 [Myxococcaceae bacterium GXIMD 01537]